MQARLTENVMSNSDQKTFNKEIAQRPKEETKNNPTSRNSKILSFPSLNYS
jgi:hypothetical protein